MRLGCWLQWMEFPWSSIRSQSFTPLCWHPKGQGPPPPMVISQVCIHSPTHNLQVDTHPFTHTEMYTYARSHKHTIFWTYSLSNDSKWYSQKSDIGKCNTYKILRHSMSKMRPSAAQYWKNLPFQCQYFTKGRKTVKKRLGTVYYSTGLLTSHIIKSTGVCNIIGNKIDAFQMSWTGNGNQNTFHWHYFSDLEFVNPNYTQFVNYTCYVLFSGKFQPGCSILLSNMYVSNMLHTELQACK